MEKTATVNLRVNPFSVTLPKIPLPIYADAMTTEEIHQKLEKGYDDIAAGRVQNAADAFRKIQGESLNETIKTFWKSQK